MTGYGGAYVSKAGIKVTVDVSSLNRKQGEVFISLPRDFDSLEPLIREDCNSCISRGRLTVRVGIQVEEGTPTMSFNEKIAADYIKEIRILGKKLGLPGEISLEKLLDVPGVMESKTSSLTPEKVWPQVRATLKKAMSELIAMREREGKNLAKDLVKRVEGLKKILKKIEKESKGLPGKYKEIFLKRIQQSGITNIQPNDPRVIQEVVIFVDRSDITEEITRLKSHFSQFDHATKCDKPVGRMLDFLAQEMGREINTIGSKANDGVIASCVVEFKTELEKFREQVQNVE